MTFCAAACLVEISRKMFTRKRETDGWKIPKNGICVFRLWRENEEKHFGLICAKRSSVDGIYDRPSVVAPSSQPRISVIMNPDDLRVSSIAEKIFLAQQNALLSITSRHLLREN